MLLEHEKRVVRISISCKIRLLPVLVFPTDAEVAVLHTGIVSQGERRGKHAGSSGVS